MSRRWFEISLAALLLTSCASQHRDWAFVQSVGGMALGTPYRAASGILLPVAIDVSGLKAITTTPRMTNSGLALKQIVVRREGDSIAITVVTTLAGDPSRRISSGDLPLGDLQPGRYAVVYAEPNGGRVDLGEITVAR